MSLESLILPIHLLYFPFFCYLLCGFDYPRHPRLSSGGVVSW